MADIKEIDRQYARLTAIEQAVKMLEITGITNIQGCPDTWVLLTAKQIEAYIMEGSL